MPFRSIVLNFANRNQYPTPFTESKATPFTEIQKGIVQKLGEFLSSTGSMNSFARFLEIICEKRNEKQRTPVGIPRKLIPRKFDRVLIVSVNRQFFLSLMHK